MMMGDYRVSLSKDVMFFVIVVDDVKCPCVSEYVLDVKFLISFLCFLLGVSFVAPCDQCNGKGDGRLFPRFYI